MENRQLCANCRTKAELIKFALETAGYPNVKIRPSRNSFQIFYDMKR